MAGVDASLRVESVTVDREHGLHVTFEDGRECAFNLMELRLACPCAGCRGDRERGVEPWPKAASPIPLRITDAALVGAWGLSLSWNDHHAGGIYPWESLRRWCEEGEYTLTPDSGLRS